MELFKTLKNRKFIAAVILLLLLNCVSFYISQQKDIEDSGVNIKAYSAVFKDNKDIFGSKASRALIAENSRKFEVLKSFADTQKLKGESPEEYEFYAEEEAELIKKYPDLYREYKTGKYSYEELSAAEEFYSYFSSQLDYQNGYGGYIASIIKNAGDLSSKRIFADKNSYSYKSIQRSAGDFSKNKNIKLSLVNDLPVSAVLNYQIGDFVLIVLCVFLALSFVSKKNINLLVNSCKNGRVSLKLKQLPILCVFSLVFSLFIFLTEIFIALEIYNAPLNPRLPIQSSDMFSDCVLHMDFIGLFAMCIVFKALVAMLISLLIWYLITLSSNFILVSAVAGVIAAAELLFYKNISEQSNLSFLKTFNIFSLFDYNSITDYKLLSFFTYPVRADILIWSVILLAVLALTLALVLRSRRNYPVKSPKKAFRSLHKLSDKLSSFYTKLQSLCFAGRYESFKIMHVGKGLLVIVAFLLIIGFTFNTNSLVFSPTEMFLNDYYSKYSGELDEDVYKSIDKMKTELAKVDAEFNLKSEQYRRGEISFEDYQYASAKSEAYDTQRKALDELTQQVERIKPLAKKGIKPVLINEPGYNSLFSKKSNENEILLLVCVVVILFSSVFSIEKTSNMLALNHSSKNGRKQLYFKKIFAVIPKTFVLTAISYLSLIAQNDYLYKLGNSGANIHNLQCLSDVNINISIFGYMILNFVFEFVFITAVALVVSALSAFLPQLVTIIISACVFILPSALYMINADSAKEISAIYQFNFNSLILDKGFELNTFIIHLGLLALCAAMLVFSQRKWCKTKVR